MIDPKHLKGPKAKEVMRSYYAPKHIHEFLANYRTKDGKSLNLTSVCISALQKAIEVAKQSGKRESKDLGQYSFKVDETLAQDFKDAGESISEVCSKALLDLYAELKAKKKR
jgi:hypothetical protein